MADQEARSNYLAARRIGRKFVSDYSSSSTKGYLLVLDDIIKDVEIVSELNLGYREIPLNKVIGTRTSARSSAFAGNFMPLLPDNTEFGIKWIKLYESHINEGIRDPIKVYEYINRYFVLEGNKRVSVLKYLNAGSIFGNVIRLIPRRDESNTLVSMYYEFLDFDKRQVFDNLWFTYKGSFTRLVELVQKFQAAHPEITASTAELINSSFKSFRVCYKRAGLASLPITSGDAFLEFIEIFGFSQMETTNQLQELIHSCEAQFKLISSREAMTINTVEMKRADEKTGFSVFSKRPQSLKIAFAFESTPEISLWTYSHDIARKRLIREMGDKITVTTKYKISAAGSYDALRELMDEEPDILFATSPNMSNAALRLSLERPNKAILNCDGAQPKKNMMTYFTKLHEATYLCGILAGAMTRTGRLGYMTPARFHQNLTYGINAFALGARMVRPNAIVVNYRQTIDADESEHIHARAEFAKRGVDFAYCQHQMNSPLVRKAFPGVFAQLYVLNPSNGHPLDCIGAAAYDWSVFYNQIVGDIFKTKSSIVEISREGSDSAVHFGWGIDTGVVDVFGVDAFMGHNAVKLMKIFRNLIISGEIHIFEGPLVDSSKKIRFDKDDMPTLVEIQNMDWLLDSVMETIEG